MKTALLKIAGLLAGVLLAQIPTGHAEESPRTIIVMDGSGSMWGQIDGRPKLEIAREAVADVVTRLPVEQELGLIAYGHRSKGDCGDIELLVPPGKNTGQTVVGAVNAMRFLGKTPLSAAVRQAAEALRYGEESATVVLVTDGLETCEADPCALASELEAAGVNFTAHVVGFGLSKEEGAQVACLAENTGGRYIEAANAGELSDALSEAITMAPPRETPHFPGRPLMPNIQLQPTGQSFGPEVAAPQQPDFPRNGTAQDCRALAEADATTAAWMFEPPGSYFVEEPRCRLFSYSTEMDWVELPPADGWVSGFKTDAILFVRPLEEVAIEPGKAGMVNRGPYAVGVAQIELGVLAEGSETGGAALALRLYPSGDASPDAAITYSTVEGTEGAKDAAIELAAPGAYLLRLETWGGDKLDEMEINVEADPVVTLKAPSVVAPGAPIEIETTGSQLRSDGIEIWQGENQIDWGRTLSELAAGQPLTAPTEPGTYDLVYKGYDASGERREKARISLDVGTPDATPLAGNLPRQKADAGPGATNGLGEDVAYSCDGPSPCQIGDAATGLSFMLPAGWWTDYPSTDPYTAGAQSAGEKLPPHVNFFRNGTDDSLVLGPRQWVAMNGPCENVGALGQFCMFQSDDPQVLAAYQLVKATLKWEQQQATQKQGGQPGFTDGLTPVTFRVPSEYPQIPREWSVVPAGNNPAGDAAWTFEPETVFNTELTPGQWEVTASKVGTVNKEFRAVIEVVAGQPKDFIIPPADENTTQAETGSQPDFAAGVQQGLAGQDQQTKAMIGALLGAAQNVGPNGEIDQKAIMGALLGAMQGAAPGAAQGCDDGQGHGPDNCENGKEVGKAWTDYPHRCLPGDKTVESCDMRDAATNLAFYLPEGWVADVTPATPFPRVEFAENAGSAHSIWLNPADWQLGERGCEITRVGRLCTDPDRADEKLASVFRTLQFTLTTGRVLRRCGDEPCAFGFEGSPISGHLPARWSVEFGETLPDGRVSTWFWDMGRGGNFRLMGLNQRGGDNCWELQPGDEICEFTSNIPQEESNLIINMIVPPAPQDRKPASQASPPRTLKPDDMKALLDLIGRN
ncbi:VWA domain-containing protein [Ciceribacter sp. L1K22]|uniref:vWA domain-containing protein n=1 Tax=Ciceribacter sp. L1K22 TaxID=2820275 RepID=UPI001ABE142C|nr:VWA domain-containing protein [Ciceribacter sp. L1K22]MBO3758970.1 VWA domain-containing protein [Ciceribacter sp. L1K22]